MPRKRQSVVSLALIGILFFGGLVDVRVNAAEMDLESGAAHRHTRTAGESTAEQRATAEKLVADTRSALVRFEDFKQAIAEGYQEATPPGMEPRPFGPAHYRNPRHIHDGKLLDPEHPEGLVYWKRPDGRMHLLGAYFAAPMGQGPEVGGPLTRWHNHVGKCPPGLRGEKLANMNPPRCGPDAVPGPHAPEMLHVWLFDHPHGAFADHLGQAGVRKLVATYGSDFLPPEFRNAQGRVRPFLRTP